MNSAQRNFIKKQVEELKLRNTSLNAGMFGWGFIGVATLVTVIGPYLCYGYIRKYRAEKEENVNKIRELESKLNKGMP